MLKLLQTNILVDADGHVRVSFFHGAAPELINPQHFRLTNTGATKASDVYAFGVLAWEVSGTHVGSSGSIPQTEMGTFSGFCWASSILRGEQGSGDLFDAEWASTG